MKWKGPGELGGGNFMWGEWWESGSKDGVGRCTTNNGFQKTRII